MMGYASGLVDRTRNALGGMLRVQGNDRPDQPPRLTPDQQRDLTMVEDRYRYARQAKLPLLENWATCLAFFVGEQWRNWEPQTKRLVMPENIPKWRVLLKDNQIPGILDVASAKLARSRQMPRCLPNTDEPEDKAAAQLGTKALEHWWHVSSMGRREFEGNVQRLLFGAAFFHPYWDAQKEGRVAVPQGYSLDPETGQTKEKLRTVKAAIGDLCVETLSVFDVFPEPGERWEDASWVIVARRRSLHWFRDTFGDDAKGITPDNEADQDALSSLVPSNTSDSLSTLGNQGGPLPEGDGQATLKVYYQRRSRQFPKGRQLLVAGGRILWQQDELPLPDGKIPLVMFPYRYVPKRQWPMGLIEVLLGQQKELNRGQSNIAELLNLHRGPKWVIEEGSLKVPINSAPDQNIKYKPNTQPPVLVAPPPLPAQILQYPDLQRAAIQQLSGQHDVSEGSAPANVDTAAGLGLLAEADNTRLSAPANLGRYSIQDLSLTAVQTIVARYRERRMILTFGRDRQEQVQALTGADIGDRDVLVDLIEGVADTDAVRMQQILDWMGVGLFQLPLPMQLTILREVGQTWLADAIEQVQPELEQMQQQQLAAQQGLQQQEQDAAAQQQQLEAQGTAQQQDQQAQAAEQQQALQAQQAGQQATQAERGHAQQLRHQEEAHQAELAAKMQQMQLAVMAAKQQQAARAQAGKQTGKGK